LLIAAADIGLDTRWRCANLPRKDVATDNGRRTRRHGGGVYWNQAREALKSVPPGGSVWTFGLMPE
jgi:hypothetical protein